jgi:hypothetical protein
MQQGGAKSKQINPLSAERLTYNAKSACEQRFVMATFAACLIQA